MLEDRTTKISAGRSIPRLRDNNNNNDNLITWPKKVNEREKKLTSVVRRVTVSNALLCRRYMLIQLENLGMENVKRFCRFNL